MGGVPNESSGFSNFVHNCVAGIDTLGAVDAFHLEAVSNIDSGGTGHYAGAAVDAIPPFLGRFFFSAGELLSLFSSVVVVSDDQGISVDEGGLKPPVGTGDQTGLLSEVCEVEEDQSGGSEHDQECRRVFEWRAVHPLPEGFDPHEVGEEDVGHRHRDQEKDEVF